MTPTKGKSTPLFIALIVWASCLNAAAARTEQPNIVIILADDMGYGDLGCYNPDSRIPTPNLDRIAREGLRFTDAHSASAVCTPSRYALLTGRYCWRTPLKYSVLFNFEPPLIEPGRTTIASMLKRRDYRTAMIGKWHLGLDFSARPGREIDFNQPLPWQSGPEPDRGVAESVDFSQPATGGPEDLGFDEAFYTGGCSTDQQPYCFIENRKFLNMERATYRRPERSIRSGMTSPDWRNDRVDLEFAARAETFLKRAARQPGPFFLYLALSSPHSPHFVPKEAEGKSAAGWRGDLVWLVDSIVGRIDRALRQSGAADNTLLIATSDNGPLAGSLKPSQREGAARPDHGHKSAGDLRGFKARIHEGGHRVPFLIRWPGRTPRGAVSDALIGQNDLLATLAAATRTPLAPGEGEDSFNLLPVLLGRRLDQEKRPPLIQHAGRAAFALREGPWKLILQRPIRGNVNHPWNVRGELYNLAVDPGETRDLWEQQPSRAARMSRLLQAIEAGRASVQRAAN